METMVSEQRLDKAVVDADPFIQFKRWFDMAQAADLIHPNAMSLATATPEGIPSVRTVLLKEFDARGFVFFTNYESRKGLELKQNPWAALVFWWGKLHRQIRIEGRVSRVTNTESDAYFATRPRESQLSAWASHQSQTISGRNVLEQRLAELEEEYAGKVVPRPPYWGGYRLAPVAIEFWQGHRNRLHDRLKYVKQVDGSWSIECLSP